MCSRKSTRSVPRAVRSALYTGLVGILVAACETPQPVQPPGPFVGDWNEVAQVGALETPEEEVFGDIRRALLAEAGGVVILDDLAARVIGFDERGRHAFTLGGRGPGPDELLGPSALIRITDDTLAVLNRSARTIQLFARDERTAYAEWGRFTLPFWPSDGCSMQGRIFILGGHKGLAVHEVDGQGTVLRSFPASDHAAEVVRGVPESIAWDLRDQAQSGRLICSQVSNHIIHVPSRLGWVRAYHPDGALAWHAHLPDFVKLLVLPAAGGAVRTDLDPEFNLGHSVAGAGVALGTHLALSIEVHVPRGQEAEVNGLFALLDLKTGAQTRRDEFAGVVMAGRGNRIAVRYRDPFPRLSVLVSPDP